MSRFNQYIMKIRKVIYFLNIFIIKKDFANSFRWCFFLTGGACLSNLELALSNYIKYH